MPAAEILEMIRAEEAVARFNAEIARSRDAIRRADDALRAKTITERQHRQLVTSEAEQIDRNTRALQKQEKALRRGERAQRGFTGGAQGAAYGMLYLSQAIEDAQYGFHSIINNIPLVLMSLGVGPGLAGVASLAAVAVNQLKFDLLGLQGALEGTFAQGALGSGGKLPWAPGGWMEQLSVRWHKSVDETAKSKNILVRLNSQMWQAILGTGAPNAGDAQRAEKHNKALEKAAKEREEAINEVLRITRKAGQEAELARAAGEAFRQSPIAGEDLLEKLLKATFGSAEPRPGEAAAVTKARARARGNLARMISGALKGVEADVHMLVGRLRQAGQNDLAEKLVEALIPANEELMRRRATEFFQKLAAGFEAAAKGFDFTLPGLTAKGRQQMAGKFQANIEGAGVAPDLQAAVARLFTGQGARQRLAALNVIVPILAQQGATQREVYEALPRIFANMDRGMNVFRATEAAVRDLDKGGDRAWLQGAGQSPMQQQLLGGLAMLGLHPNAPAGQTSRFRWPRSRVPGADEVPGGGDNFPAPGGAANVPAPAMPGVPNAPGWGVINPATEAVGRAVAKQNRLAAERRARAQEAIDEEGRREAEARPGRREKAQAMIEAADARSAALVEAMKERQAVDMQQTAVVGELTNEVVRLRQNERARESAVQRARRTLQNRGRP